MLFQGMSYKLVGVSVRFFGSVRYLSVGSDCEIVRVDDIGEVVDDDTADEEFGVVNYVVEGDIGGVYYCDVYSGRMSCESKVQSVDGIIGECGKCGVTIKMRKCIKGVMARVTVSKDGKNLMLFSGVIH